MKREVKIGLTVIGGLLAVYLVITWAKSTHLFAASKSNYDILFSNVSGLKEGDPVTVNGYPSGNVSRILPEKAGIRVTILLDEDIQLYPDARPEIVIKELMGGKQIEIKPGGFAASNTALQPGAELLGTTSMDFSSAFSKMGDFMDQFDADDIDTLVGNLNTVAASFAEVARELQQEDIGKTVRELTSSVSTLNRLLNQVEGKQIIRKVDGLLASITTLTGKAEQTLSSIDDLSGHLTETTLPKADTMLTQVNGMLDDTQEAVSAVSDLLGQLQDRNTAIGKFLHDPDFANQLTFTLDNLNKTLDHIRTKKIFVSMRLNKKQKFFPEDVEGEETKKKNKKDK